MTMSHSRPLSDLSAADLNYRSPASPTRNLKTLSPSKSQLFRGRDNLDAYENFPPSSPFSIDLDVTLQRSPTKSGSPLRRGSPERSYRNSPRSRPQEDDTLRPNEGLTRAFNIMEDPTATLSNPASKASDLDESCFSTFSAVPNVDMTSFARSTQQPLDQSSPNKSPSRKDPEATNGSYPETPGSSRRDQVEYEQTASPTPKQRYQQHMSDNTTQLLEFTETMNLGDIQSSKIRPSPRKTHTLPNRGPNTASYRMPSPIKEGLGPATPNPGRNFPNLLDFDLPPAPTPRSIPTITTRELESLKATFANEISSLKAALSGKEAEIKSLTESRDEVERRNIDLNELYHENKDAKEHLQAEKSTWDRRDTEMQKVLRDVREDIRHTKLEHEEMASANTEMRSRLENAEAHAAELESKLNILQENPARTTSPNSSDPTDPSISTPHSSASLPTPSSKTTQAAVEAAVDKVARELHALYKAKHETKVSALKKSYEARWEKRLGELQTKVEALTQENDELRIGKDATLSGPMEVPSASNSAVNNSDETKAELALREEAYQQLLHRTDILQGEVGTLRERLGSLEGTNSLLSNELATSRRENSDLVAAVEQMLALEATTPTPSTASETIPERETLERSQSSGNGVRAKASGLRGPGFGMGESRIGMGMGLGLKRSVSGTGTASGTASRSAMMSNIERMNSGRA